MGEEDKRKGKAGLQKFKHQKAYQRVDDDTQFKVPKRVEEDKKISHKQVFGSTAKSDSKRSKKQTKKKRSKY